MKAKTLVLAVGAFAAIGAVRAETYYLGADDARDSTSFNSKGNWKAGSAEGDSATGAPSEGNSYIVENHKLRTQTGDGSVFGGDSLTIRTTDTTADPTKNNAWGQLMLKQKANTTNTVDNLILENGCVPVSDENQMKVLAGNVTIPEGYKGYFGAYVGAQDNNNRFLTLASSLKGDGTAVLASYNNKHKIWLTGDNSAFAGKVIIGTDGQHGSVTLQGGGLVSFDSANSWFGELATADDAGVEVLGKNAGTLAFTVPMTIGSNSNRGLTIGVGGSETIEASADVTLNTKVSSTNGFTKAGAGVLTLGAANTALEGTVNVTAGGIRGTCANAFGTAQLNFSSGAKLYVDVACDPLALSAMPSGVCTISVNAETLEDFDGSALFTLPADAEHMMGGITFEFPNLSAEDADLATPTFEEKDGRLALTVEVAAPRTCTWTGAAGDKVWENGNNWDTGVAPLLKDTAVFGATGVGQDDVITLSESADIAELRIDAAVNFSFAPAADSTPAMSFKKLTKTDASTTNTFVTGVALAGSGTNLLEVAGAVKFSGTVSSLAGTVILQTGGGEVELAADNNGTLGTTQNAWIITEGRLAASVGNAFNGTLRIGGTDAAAEVVEKAGNAVRNTAVTIETNGVFRLAKGENEWNKTDTFNVYPGGRVIIENSGTYHTSANINLYGGAILPPEGAEGGKLKGDNNPKVNVTADVTSVLGVRYDFAPNDNYCATFNVDDGAAPVDLLITGLLAGGGSKNALHTKNNPGTVLCTTTNTFIGKGPANGNGFEVRGGTWLVDGGSGFGQVRSAVTAGGTVGGTGWIGGYEGADFSAVGSEGNLAKVRPGTIDIDESSETYGSHVYGALTVGSETVANAMDFGSYSCLEVGFGGGRLHDALAVKGAATIDATGTVLRIVNEAQEGVKVRGGAYTVLSAAGGLTGTFDSVECVGFRHAPEVTYRETEVIVTIPASGLVILVK